MLNAKMKLIFILSIPFLQTTVAKFITVYENYPKKSSPKKH